MTTVPEFELKQKTSEFVNFVRDFANNTKRDVKLWDKKDGYVINIIDKDVILDFSL